ncbi:hypothetical protein DVA86_24320 [Streptomyces armeniacus]|uniref:Tetratricopeptide repeat protein n=1 Tax=Streptomyces armeniacus TaxID=83291 RepID=A0A345XUI5_9ACTN|nr:tetratricopeptide repeat protein [Streptomyces armeniacus]AXK35301.1 hypothetical protein DVA86_24320 [Streptomyces armeniacus]
MGTLWTRSRDPMTACAETCADYLAALDGPPDAGRLRLAASLGALLGTRGFDALLHAGAAALDAAEPGGGAPGASGESEARLALRLADTALEIRRKSKGAWRLRARALETLERPSEAIEAYERYLELSEGGPAAYEVALHLATLKERRACLAQALEPGADGGGTDGCPYARAFAEAVHGERPEAETRRAFTAHVGARMRERGAADPDVRRLTALYATYCRLAAQPRITDPLLGDCEPLGIGELRGLVEGRRVCLVSNAGELATGPDARGAEIDAYDLVVRCDAYRAGTPGGGARTDVHAVSPAPSARRAQLRHARWYEPVRARIVFAESGDDWQRAVRELVPGAQRYAGDVALRRPLADPALIGEGGWGGRPSTAFTVLRLLDFLDVSSAIDLFGYELPGQLRREEREWVTAHAKGSGEIRMSLR